MLGTANSGRRVTVVGAGIGGLTTAIAFARSGAEVTVLEQAHALTEIGAGVQLSPNGVAPLRALGLAPQIEARALRTEAVVPTDALTGRSLARMDVSADPFYLFYRPDLIALLGQGCAEAGVNVRTGFRVSCGPEGADLGQDSPPDLVIGADGLRSRMRPLLNGSDDPFFTGQVAWRAIIPLAGQPPVARVWMAPGQHVVTYPLRGDRLNVVAVREQKEWAPEGWNLPDVPAAMQAAFAQCGEPLRGILGAVKETALWGLFRHPVAPQWHGLIGQGSTDGGQPLALLGDAAHPTLPFLAQGANLAIEDAWVLAACCAAEADLTVALARYQAKRRDRVSRAIAVANGNATRFHLSGAPRVVSQMGLRTMGKFAPRLLLKPLDWLYKHDVTRD